MSGDFVLQHGLPLVVLFAKAPVPGRVKTRLGVDPQRAAALHSSFVRQTLVMLESLSGEVDVELSTDEPTLAWGEFPVARSVQAAGHLGERIYAALERALAAGRPKAMILGSDSPGLPAAHIRALLGSSADVSIGPVDDGGFYAIACSRTVPAMFEGVRWSTGATLSDTVKALTSCGLGVDLGPAWFDVDRPEDLARLPTSL
jgi:rSAM/selenodomain-associated transferase 1